MRGVNKVILIGNVGQDPDVRVLPSGEKVANFSLAVNESYKDRNGERVERTEWFNCAAWGKLAEIVSEYVRKGQALFLMGALKTEKWQDRQGQDRYTTKVNVRELQMLGGKRQDDGEEQPRREERSETSEKREEFDDDIPF